MTCFRTGKLHGRIEFENALLSAYVAETDDS